MADGYLEKHFAEYEKRKAEWMRKKKKHITGKKEVPHKVAATPER